MCDHIIVVLCPVCLRTADQAAILSFCGSSCRYAGGGGEHCALCAVSLELRLCLFGGQFFFVPYEKLLIW